MPRMNMFIQNNGTPRIVIGQPRLNQGAQQRTNLMNMAFKAPIIDRIAGLKPGCSACGKH